MPMTHGDIVAAIKRMPVAERCAVMSDLGDTMCLLCCEDIMLVDYQDGKGPVPGTCYCAPAYDD